MPSGVYTRTEEHRKIHSDAMGRVSSREKMSKARLGKSPWNKGKKGLQKWSKETRKKMESRIPSFIGRKHSKESKEKMRKSAMGIHTKEKNGMWKGGITLFGWQIRNSSRYSQWRSDIFRRDQYLCQCCGKTKCKIEAHHIKMFSKILTENEITSMEDALICEELWDITNGITLCKACHKIENIKQQTGNKYAVKNTNS